jgi:hypothetical protein
MVYQKYGTNKGSSGTGNSFMFSVFERSTGDFIGSAYTVNGGETWRVRGLFPDRPDNFESSGNAIKAVCLCYESANCATAAPF